MNWCCVVPVLIISITIGVYFAYQYFYIPNDTVYWVFINPKNIVFETDKRFLSVALDTSFMGCMFHQLNEGDWKKLEELSRLLSPAYLRLGGTAADLTVFSLNDTTSFTKNDCMDVRPNETIIITDKDWTKINRFAENAGFSFIMDLNVLQRSKSEWNSSNARSLIDFSERKGFKLDFQLGNEPNSFRYVFNVEIPAVQLAKDFYSLRTILQSTKAYQNSKLIGPDITRPKNAGEPSLKYLNEFLKKNVVDVVSWHQYYLNGRTATLEDFINPKTFNLLPPQIKAVAEIVRRFSSTVPIWLSETSSAYGSGAPELSNRFAASFLWVDKLGTAARLGISVVIRQTLFEKHYALINDDFSPTPDFWISLLYKKLVGSRVLDLKIDNDDGNLRVYAHCTSDDSSVNGNIVIYGLNLRNEAVLMELPDLKIKSSIHAYIFTPEFNKIKAKSVLLNDNLLTYNASETPDLVKMYEQVELPLVLDSYTIGFWVFDADETACAA